MGHIEKVKPYEPYSPPGWAACVRPGDTLIVGLAETDNVAKVAKGMQGVLEPLGVNVVVLDNVQQMVVVRPDGGEV